MTQWRTKLASSNTRPDPGQEPILQALAGLAERLERKLPSLSPPQQAGLYIWGKAGGGKSMLMNLFFDSLPLKHKKRLHFHEFMIQTHANIAQWRKTSPPSFHADPIPAIAKSFFSKTRLLCFDEFHVNDIADAMLLGRLFEQILERRMVIVATSNRHPDDLYKDGLNRELFEPFITMLKTRTRIIELRAQKDYRLYGLKEEALWRTPLGKAAQAHMETLWQHISADRPVKPVRLKVNGRSLLITHTVKGYARMQFADLCATPLGANDYLVLAKQFHTLLLEDIPIMPPEKRNEAARFVILIDSLYEAGTRLIASAEAEPEALYPHGHGAFEFKRTASRLHEMRQSGFGRLSSSGLSSPA